jgi:hypothetical protein
MKTNKATTCRDLAQFFACLVAICTLAGCAGTAPDARFTQAFPPGGSIGLNDTVRARVEPRQGVSMLSSEKQRLTEQIETKIRATARARSEKPRAYEIDVQLTRYDKGSAFARGMMAGLGAMHIDGNVSVYQLPNRARIAEFQLDKTFAWGGIYGAATTIEAIEEAFAQGIANTVCGTARP